MLDKSIDQKFSSPDFARYDPHHAIPRLFRVFGKGERGRKWEETYTVKNGSLTVKFEGETELGIGDESVLLAIVALGGTTESVTLTNAPKKPENIAMRKLLDPLGDSVEHMCTISTSQRQLMKFSGHSATGSKMWRLIEESLHRLYKTTVWVRENETGWSYPMPLIAFAINSKSKRLLLGLNQQLSKAIFGERWVTISLHERHQLRGDTAKALHRWISAWLGPGKTNKIGIHQLMKHVFGDSNDVSSSQRYKRKKLTEKGLNEIGDLAGWRISSEDDIYRISRPKLPRNSE